MSIISDLRPDRIGFSKVGREPPYLSEASTFRIDPPSDRCSARDLQNHTVFIWNLAEAWPVQRGWPLFEIDWIHHIGTRNLSNGLVPFIGV